MLKNWWLYEYRRTTTLLLLLDNSKIDEKGRVVCYGLESKSLTSELPTELFSWFLQPIYHGCRQMAEVSKGEIDRLDGKELGAANLELNGSHEVLVNRLSAYRQCQGEDTRTPTRVVQWHLSYKYKAK